MPQNKQGKKNKRVDSTALEDIARRRARIQQERESLLSREASLDEEEQQVAAQASQLEEQARALAAEEARLQERSKKLQQEKRTLAQRRDRLADQRKKNKKERQALQSEEEKLDDRQAAIEQQVAYQEAQKQASVEHAPRAEQSAQSPGTQRTHERVKVAVEVSMHTEHNFYTGLTENISEGGLFIATYENLPIGTTIDVELGLPDHPPIQSRAQVRWMREHSEFTEDVSPGVGVQFIDLGDDERRAIEAFLQKRPPLFFETD